MLGKTGSPSKRKQMDKGMEVLGARATLERAVPGKGGKQGPVLKAAG